MYRDLANFNQYYYRKFKAAIFDLYVTLYAPSLSSILEGILVTHFYHQDVSNDVHLDHL